MPGSCSIVDSSNTDCALSVTGPYESTAIVTGPMPRNPNATRPNANTTGLGGLMLAPAVFAFGLVAFGFLGMGPNANTVGASINPPRPVVLTPKAIAISVIIV